VSREGKLFVTALIAGVFPPNTGYIPASGGQVYGGGTLQIGVRRPDRCRSMAHTIFSVGTSARGLAAPTGVLE